MTDTEVAVQEADDPFLQKHRATLFRSAGLYQRRILIESLRKGESFDIAMKNAGIEDRFVALEIYKRNSRIVTKRVLVSTEHVR